MAASQRSTINLGLPAVPETIDAKLFFELVRVYNAINILAQGLDSYTSDGTTVSSIATINASLVDISTTIGDVIDNSAQFAELKKNGVFGTLASKAGLTVNAGGAAITGATAVTGNISATGTVAAGDQVSGVKNYSVAPALRAISSAVNTGSTFASTNADITQFLVGYSGASTDPTQAIWWNAGQTLRFATCTTAQAAGFTLVATLDVTGFKSVAGLGCNGKAPQAAVVLPANATDLATVITLTNAIKAALVANGIGA